MTTIETPTTTDPTTTHPTTTIAPIVSVPFDLYRDIHKAIRAQLFEVTVAAGRLDPHDCTARVAHAGRVRDLVRFLVMHAEHEERHMDDAIARVLPDQVDAIAVEHAALEAVMEDLVALADLAFEPGRGDDRAAVHMLYLELAAFTSRYLAHQDVEERVVMTALSSATSFDDLLGIHEAILASISPDDMGWSLSLMLPAMNIDDRFEMLAGMRAGAPAEVFAGVWALAGQVLEPSDLAALTARLDEVAS